MSTGRVVEAILKAIIRPLEAGVAETLALVATVVALAVLLPTMGIVGQQVVAYCLPDQHGVRALSNVTRARNFDPQPHGSDSRPASPLEGVGG